MSVGKNTRGLSIMQRSHLFPRNEAGDVNFTLLGDKSTDDGIQMDHEEENFDISSLFYVFSPAEVLKLVNQALYHQEYMRESHKKRAKEENERLKPVKAKVHELFHVSWINATPAQIQVAVDAVAKSVKEVE